MCYTNHALDSFLEDMLGKGITDIVRIGGGSKNSKLDPYQLRSRQASGFDRVQNRRFAHLKGALEESQQSIEDVQRVSRLNSKPEKMAVVAWLEDEDPEAFQELQMPDGLGAAGDTVVGRKVSGRDGWRGNYVCDRAAFFAVSCPRFLCCLSVLPEAAQKLSLEFVFARYDT